jgi:hypothetical protein
MNSSKEPAPDYNRRRIALAFATGAVVHALLLALAMHPSINSDLARQLLLVVALPGLVVDMSAEMIHPSEWGGFALAGIASLVNGIAYATAVFVVLKWRARNTRP